MPFSLPPELIRYHVVPYLSPRDILSVYEAFHWQITEREYRLAFHDSAILDHYDLQTFKERLNARLYVFGADDHNPLAEIPARTELAYVPQILKTNRGRVLRAPLGDLYHEIVVSGDIVQAQTFEENVYILTGDGQLYYRSHYDKDRDGNPFERADTAVQRNAQRLRTDTDTFLVEISVCLAAVFALDSEGRVWYWTLGHECELGRLVDNLGPEPVLRISADNYSCALLVQGRGVGVVTTTAEVTFVPGTAHLRGFVLFQDLLFFLKDGLVCRLDMDGKITKEIHLCQHGPFVNVSTSHYELDWMCEDGYTVMFYKNGGSSTEDLAATSVSSSLGHRLILTKKGDVYTDGTELGFTGCLGLWPLQEYRDEVKYTDSYLQTKRPVKIRTPGRVFDVFAGTNYSAVLMSTDEQ